MLVDEECKIGGKSVAFIDSLLAAGSIRLMCVPRLFTVCHREDGRCRGHKAGSGLYGDGEGML